MLTKATSQGQWLRILRVGDCDAGQTTDTRLRAGFVRVTRDDEYRDKKVPRAVTCSPGGLNKSTKNKKQVTHNPEEIRALQIDWEHRVQSH